MGAIFPEKAAKLIRLFVKVAGFLLLVTAIAKLISSMGEARILKELDPVVHITFKMLFMSVGLCELIIALFCILTDKIKLQVICLAWLSTGFLLYHFAIWWIGYRKPCPCLGNLTDALHIPPQTADTAMKIILAYLLIGSYATLFWLWRQRKRVVPASAS